MNAGALTVGNNSSRRFGIKHSSCLNACFLHELHQVDREIWEIMQHWGCKVVPAAGQLCLADGGNCQVNPELVLCASLWIL